MRRYLPSHGLISTSRAARTRLQHAPARLIRSTVFALATAALFAQASGLAQPAAASLPYARGFLVTGDYAVGGVDLREDAHPIVNGFSTAAIPMSGVPANADIIAAYLFWETVVAMVATVGDRSGRRQVPRLRPRHRAIRCP